MAKVNVYIPDDMLERIDGIAAEQGRSRSSLVQEAMAQYVTRSQSDAEREERRHSIVAAMEDMARLREEAAKNDPYPDVSWSEFLIEQRHLGHDATAEEIVESIRRRHRGEE